MVEGVVLDVDDTLYLERDYVRSGFRAVGRWCAEELGVVGLEQVAWSLFLAGRRRTTLTDALELTGVSVTSQLRSRVIEVYRDHPPDICLLDDVQEFLRRARGAVRLGVLTDGPAVSQEAKCRALGLTELADPIVVTARLGTNKPDPAPFRLVEEVWGLAGAQVAYVADNPHKDFIAPLAIGWTAVRLRRALGLHHDIPTPEGVLEATGFHDLPVGCLVEV